VILKMPKRGKQTAKRNAHPGSEKVGNRRKRSRRELRASRQVVAVEYDPYRAMHLRERFSDDDNVRVVQGDALTMRLPKEPFVVVANIPFNTTILHRLLDDPTSLLRSAHLLVQTQVALKHARSTPSTLKTLNWSSWYEFSAGLELPADSFHPAGGRHHAVDLPGGHDRASKIHNAID
jgi:16S rRNA A1518/A1519 N6-dimethyltransferase RsmA/KsgA/DIM1 with predicted DNA glycosylase/AP lyase activity